MFKNNHFGVVYYILLLLYFITWSNTGSVPNIIIRSIYIVAIFLPVLLGHKEYAPAIVIMYFTLCVYGLPNYLLPSNSLFYIGVLVFVVVISGSYNKKPFVPFALILILIQSILINAIQSSSNPILYPSLAFILLAFLCNDNKEKAFHLMSLAFIAISVVISYYFIIGAAQFSVAYGKEGLTREGWMDPNYMGCVIGMGVAASFIEMFRAQRKKNLYYLPYILVVLFSLFVLVQNASRGSLLSIGLCLIVLLTSTKIKVKYKTLAIIVIVILLFILYNNHYMDLLVYRMEAETGTGSGRTIIWEIKLYSFFQDSNFLEYIFGIGYESGRRIGYLHNMNYFRTFHNDFLGFFVDYGLVGLILLSSLFITPIRNKNQNFIYSLAGISFLFVICNTLEPLTGGQFAYYAFLYYIILLSRLDDVKTIEHN